jgi:hypothetical protein
VRASRSNKLPHLFLRRYLRDVDELEHWSLCGVEREPGVEDERSVVPRGEAMYLVYGVAHHDEYATLPGETLDQRDAARHSDGARAEVPTGQTRP